MKMRKQQMIFCAWCCLAVNLALFIAKLLAGAKIKSVAVYSDAFNNLTDLSSFVILLFAAGACLKRADKEHPFGHGRGEYVATLIFSIIFFGCGLGLIKMSLAKIPNPQPIVIEPFLLIGLGLLSILLKLGLYIVYKKSAKKIGAELLKAMAFDSVTDCIATTAVIISAFLDNAFSNSKVSIDGIFGVAVAVPIIYNGFKFAKSSISTLIGAEPPQELRENLEKILISHPEIIGFHDLEIHDYGYKKYHATVHAEVDKNSELIAVHEIIDSAEKEIEEKLGVKTVIHPDPI